MYNLNKEKIEMEKKFRVNKKKINLKTGKI